MNGKQNNWKRGSFCICPIHIDRLVNALAGTVTHIKHSANLNFHLYLDTLAVLFD